MGRGGGDKEPSTYCKCNRTWLLYTVCKYSKYRYHMYNSKYIKIKCFVQCFGSTSAWIRIGFSRLDPDPLGQKWPTKMGKVQKFLVLKCWMSSFEADSFSCSLNVLYESLRISKLQFLNKKILILFSCKLFKFFFIKTLDPDPHPLWPKMLDPDQHWNQCGSKTLVLFMPSYVGARKDGM